MSEKMQMHIIDEHSDEVTGQLGLSPSRANEIFHVFQKEAIQLTGINVMKGIEAASAICEHPNELVFLAFSAGRYYDNQIAEMQSAEMRSKIMEHLKNHLKKDDL